MRGDLSGDRRRARRKVHQARLLGSVTVGLVIVAYWLGRSAGLW